MKQPKAIGRIRGALARPPSSLNQDSEPPSDEWRFDSHSGEGEDMVLRAIFLDQDEGFYVDVGAHHPTRFSNTCHFYRRGWRGINVDADQRAVEALSRERPRDVNLHLGVAADEGELEFLVYNEPAVNTFDAELARQREQDDYEHKVIRSERVPVRPLAQILREHLPSGQTIDFMNVDVEGKDLEALQSNDWAAFRPRVVLVECYGAPLAGIEDHETIRFLASQGYTGVAKTLNTVILRDAR